MTHAWNASGPGPELLAAYADGALSGADLQRVVHWLADHPEARLEILEMQRLHDLMERTKPHDPGRQAWSGVVDRVHAALQSPASSKSRRRWPLAAYLGAAAAVLLCLDLGWSTLRLAEFERRFAAAEQRAVAAERTASEATRRADIAERSVHEASQRADMANCLVRQAEDRASEAERRRTEVAMDMASTPHLDLLSHDQVRLLSPSPRFRLDDWATPMVVDPTLNVRGP